MIPATENLRILIAHSDIDRLNAVTDMVTALAHEVVARNTDLASVGTLTAVERPDVAIIIVGENSEHALGLIERVVTEAVCPVIALLDVGDPTFVRKAAKRGVFAYINGAETADLQGSIEVVLCRFAEYQNLEGAFARRAMIEQAKGVLMERNGVEDQEAFELLRANARHLGKKVSAVAEAILVSRTLLPETGEQIPPPEA